MYISVATWRKSLANVIEVEEDISVEGPQILSSEAWRSTRIKKPWSEAAQRVHFV
jgi:hypothetical protein